MASANASVPAPTVGTCGLCDHEKPIRPSSNLCLSCEAKVAPPWSSTQTNPKAYMIDASELEPANVPGQRVTAVVMNAEGESVEASAPHCYYEKWITKAGTVCAVPMKTNRVSKLGVFVDNGAYVHQVRQEFYRAGWLHYDTGRLGEDPEAWLARRDREIEKRVKTQAQVMKRAEDKHNAEVSAKDSSVAKAVEKGMESFETQRAEKAARIEAAQKAEAKGKKDV